MTVNLTCNEAAEYVSALCDGETISPEAAKHIGACDACQARLRDYVSMGVELRRVASLETGAEVSPLRIEKRQGSISTLWQKGWETMRIPKLAFALMILAVVALGSTLVVVKVGAHSDGNVVMLKITTSQGEAIRCHLSTVDLKQAQCGGLTAQNRKLVGYQINLTGREGSRVELAIRTKTFEGLNGSYNLSEFAQLSPQQIWFEPGKSFELQFPGAGTMTVTGEWTDHVPTFVAESGNPDLDPGPEELRVVSPMLLVDKKVVADMDGLVAKVDKPYQGVDIYFPGHGRYILAANPIRGAIEAEVHLGRISFTENGRSYVFVTGTPVSRASHIWVLHEPNFKPSEDAKSGYGGSIDVVKTGLSSPDPTRN